MFPVGNDSSMMNDVSRSSEIRPTNNDVSFSSPIT